MEILYRWIDGINDVLWSYLLVALLLGCAVWFTLRTRGVQFRMLGEMVRVLGESAGSGPRGEKHVSSFQAFAVSLASRVGTGNLAGVATAIAVGGPGAVFWMWVIAFFGNFWHDARVNASSRNITADVLMLGLSVATLMVIEARKYGVRLVWLYIAGGFFLAISVTFPLFLIARERRMAATEPTTRVPALDVILLALLAAGLTGLTIWVDMG